MHPIERVSDFVSKWLIQSHCLTSYDCRQPRQYRNFDSWGFV